MPYTEKETINLLKEHKMKLAALTSLKSSLEALRRDRVTPREELDEKRRELKMLACRCAAEVGGVERGLRLLTSEERTVVEGFFISPPERFQCWDVLCEDLGYERTKIYRLRKTALRKLTTSLYGAAD